MVGGYQHSQQLEIIQWKDIIYTAVREFNGVGLAHFFSCFFFLFFVFFCFFLESPALSLLHMRMKKCRREEEHDLLKTRPTNVENCVFDKKKNLKHFDYVCFGHFEGLK